MTVYVSSRVTVMDRIGYDLVLDLIIGVDLNFINAN